MSAWEAGHADEAGGAHERATERARLLARAYSQSGQSEEFEEHDDPQTGERLRLRPSEWALRQFDAQAAGAATAPGGADPEPTEVTDASAHEPADPSAVDGSHGTTRPWSRVLLVAAGVVVGAVLVIAGQRVIAGLGESARLESAAAAATARPTGPSTVLQVFEQPPLDVRALPSEILAEFDALDVQRIFDPATNGGGYDVFAARKSRDLYCLVLVRTGERYLASCGTERQILTDGLRLTAVVVPAPRPVSLFESAEAPTTTQAPSWQVEVHWNRDGTFSIAGSPVGFDG